MNTQNKNVPDLRFPEFNGEWTPQELNKFLEERSEQPEESLPLYSLTIEGGIIPKSKRYERSFLVKSEEDAYKVMVKDDFAFNPMNLRFGALARHKGDEKVLVSKYYNIFFCNEKADSSYAEYFLTNYKMLQFYKKMATGSLEEKKRVHYLDFINFKLPFPTLPEQQKIAAFLTALDEKIQQLTKKKDLLEKYKKGVMQKIFNQEIRFKDDNGDDFEDWEEKTIGEISSVTAGATPSTSKKDYWDGDIRWMNSGELNLKRVYEVENRITELGLKKSSTKLIPKYCVLIGLAGQGKTRGTVAMNMIELCTNQSIAAIYPNKQTFVEDFLYHNLNTRYNELRSLSTGDGGRGGLNLQIIKSLSINLPSVAEQQKIANFFTVIDDKINLVNQQLEKTKEYKKGLLQQMFI